MKQVLKNIKVSEIPTLIAQLGFSPEQEVNLTIEENSESLISIMDKVGKKAQAKGLTEDKLMGLRRFRSAKKAQTITGQRVNLDL